MNWFRKNWLWFGVNILALLPLLAIFGGSSDYRFLTHITGEWAMRWLVVSLCCTPLYILFNWRTVLSIKKVTGLYAFGYALLHLLVFVLDEGWLATFGEVNLVMGLLSILIMLPLALTSNHWSMQHLGKGWKLLHRAVYAAGVFAVLHVALLGEGSAMLYALILILGFVIRIPPIRRTITHFRQHGFKTSPASA